MLRRLLTCSRPSLNDAYPVVDDQQCLDGTGDDELRPVEGIVLFRTPVSSKYTKHLCTLDDGELAYRSYRSRETLVIAVGELTTVERGRALSFSVSMRGQDDSIGFRLKSEHELLRWVKILERHIAHAHSESGGAPPAAPPDPIVVIERVLRNDEIEHVTTPGTAALADPPTSAAAAAAPLSAAEMGPRLLLTPRAADALPSPRGSTHARMASFSARLSGAASSGVPSSDAAATSHFTLETS